MAEPTSSPWRRYAIVALVLLGLLFFGWRLLGPGLRVGRWIADLHSEIPETVQRARQNLRTSKVEGVEERLVEGLADPELPFAVRAQLAEILLKRNRLEAVEKALREGDAAARRAALAALDAQVGRRGPEWFQREYFANPDYPVEETVIEWLGQDRDPSRAAAARIASRLELAAAVPHLRAIVTDADRLGTTSTQRKVLWQAAQALVRMGDCEAVPSFVTSATEEPDDLVRMHMLKTLYQATRNQDAACADAVPEAEVKRAVFAALDGPRNTRHHAIIILRSETAWAREAEPKLLDLLDHLPPDEFARRDALATLAASGSDAFLRRLPRYFHSGNPYVRSEAALSSHAASLDRSRPVQYVSAWIGLLEREFENPNAVTTAINSLRERAGTWIGLKDDVKDDAARRRPAWKEFKEELFEKGESRGVKRKDWAEAWWRWWATQLGLDEAAVDRAWQDREAFWQAARAGDAAKAKQVLESAPRRDEGLFTYEEGWLDARSS